MRRGRRKNIHEEKTLFIQARLCHGKKMLKKFFKPTSWLHFLRNEGDPETPPLFHREGVKKEKEKRKREEERYIRNVKSFFYTFFLVICPHC